MSLIRLRLRLRLRLRVRVSVLNVATYLVRAYAQYESRVHTYSTCGAARGNIAAARRLPDLVRVRVRVWLWVWARVLVRVVFQTSMSSGPLPGLAWTAPMTTWVADAAVSRWLRPGSRQASSRHQGAAASTGFQHGFLSRPHGLRALLGASSDHAAPQIRRLAMPSLVTPARPPGRDLPPRRVPAVVVTTLQLAGPRLGEEHHRHETA